MNEEILLPLLSKINNFKKQDDFCAHVPGSYTIAQFQRDIHRNSVTAIQLQREGCVHLFLRRENDGRYIFQYMIILYTYLREINIFLLIKCLQLIPIVLEFSVKTFASLFLKRIMQKILIFNYIEIMQIFLMSSILFQGVQNFFLHQVSSMEIS